MCIHKVIFKYILVYKDMMEKKVREESYVLRKPAEVKCKAWDTGIRKYAKCTRVAHFKLPKGNAHLKRAHKSVLRLPVKLLSSYVCRLE